MNKERSLFLLIGQSNMAGRGYVKDVPAVENSRIEMFRNGQWMPGVEPLHTDKPDIAGVGPAMSFAQKVLEHDPDMRVGLIPCAVGGTPLSRWMPGADLYTDAVRIARTALNGGVLKGILWHQGEGDSGNPELAGSYGERFSTMITALRKEVCAEGVPVVTGELGTFLQQRNPDSCYKTVNVELHRLEGRIPQYVCVSSAGLTDNGDLLHFNAASQREFGTRYAAAYLGLK